MIQILKAECAEFTSGFREGLRVRDDWKVWDLSE